jgi:hypothetical protein
LRRTLQEVLQFFALGHLLAKRLGGAAGIGGAPRHLLLDLFEPGTDLVVLDERVSSDFFVSPVMIAKIFEFLGSDGSPCFFDVVSSLLQIAARFSSSFSGLFFSPCSWFLEGWGSCELRGFQFRHCSVTLALGLTPNGLCVAHRCNLCGHRFRAVCITQNVLEFLDRRGSPSRSARMNLQTASRSQLSFSFHGINARRA